MNYPGFSIKRDSTHADIIRAVQQQLNAIGCGPIGVDGGFGDDTFNAVQLFQTRFADAKGNPLTADGIIGPATWSSLFGSDTVATVDTAPNALLTEVVNVAVSKIGVLENPLGSNSGPEVTAYLANVDLAPGNAWCMAFVYSCFKEASANLGIANPVFRTGGVLDGWENARGTKISSRDAGDNPSVILPGQIFIISTGGGHGHTGLVEKVEHGILTTIEGNTNTGGSREGIGVFRRTARSISSINVGFIQYG